MDALAVRRVVKSFAGVQALRGVDLTVRPGEVQALLGEDGAGKSTLIKVLAGVHRPDAGTVAVAGRPLPEASDRRGRRRPGCASSIRISGSSARCQSSRTWPSRPDLPAASV